MANKIYLIKELIASTLKSREIEFETVEVKGQDDEPQFIFNVGGKNGRVAALITWMPRVDQFGGVITDNLMYDRFIKEGFTEEDLEKGVEELPIWVTARTVEEFMEKLIYFSGY